MRLAWGRQSECRLAWGRRRRSESPLREAVSAERDFSQGSICCGSGWNADVAVGWLTWQWAGVLHVAVGWSAWQRLMTWQRAVGVDLDDVAAPAAGG